MLEVQLYRRLVYGGLTEFPTYSAAKSNGSATKLCLLGTVSKVQCMAGAELATASICLQTYRSKTDCGMQWEINPVLRAPLYGPCAMQKG